MNNEIKQSQDSVSVSSYKQLTGLDQQDDEINLIDIIRILSKRKNIILIIALMCSILGSCYAFLSAEVYSYSTAIRIGNYFTSNEGEKPVDTAKNIVSEAKEVIIPAVLNNYYQQNPNQAKNIDIIPSVPKDGEFIVLTAKSATKNADLYKQLLTEISQRIVTEQNKKTDDFRMQFKVGIQNAKNRLETIANTEKEINKRVDDFQKQFKALPFKDSGTTELVITELLGQLQSISKEKFALETDIANKLAFQSLTRNTEILSPVTQSIERVNVDKKIVILFSMFAGIFAGIFMALFLEFLEKMKFELKTSTF